MFLKFNEVTVRVEFPCRIISSDSSKRIRETEVSLDAMAESIHLLQIASDNLICSLVGFYILRSINYRLWNFLYLLLFCSRRNRELAVHCGDSEWNCLCRWTFVCEYSGGETGTTDENCLVSRVENRWLCHRAFGLSILN